MRISTTSRVIIGSTIVVSYLKLLERLTQLRQKNSNVIRERSTFLKKVQECFTVFNVTTWTKMSHSLVQACAAYFNLITLIGHMTCASHSMQTKSFNIRI